jgi:hypothetical protein
MKQKLEKKLEDLVFLEKLGRWHFVSGSNHFKIEMAKHRKE